MARMDHRDEYVKKAVGHGWQPKRSIYDIVDEIAEDAHRGEADDPEGVHEDVVFGVVSTYLGDEVFARRFVDCMAIIRRKNADYSQSEHRRDRIAAFKRIARDVGVSPRKAWAVFAQKHWGAIMRYVKDGFVESEPIDGRINDMINYLVLLGPIVDWDAASEAAGDDCGEGEGG